MSDYALSNPFPGPQPYRAADRPRFFGREHTARKVVNRILAHPCVTLFGPSGSGKSSLMQASVIPLLKEQHHFRVVRVDGWLAGEPPLERLARDMFVELELGKPPEGLNPRELLDEALRLAERRSQRPILIYLDQLEQLLLPGRSPEQLCELLKGLEVLACLPVRGLQLVLALREDYLGRFRDRARCNRALQDPGFRLGPLKVDEMARVVCRLAGTGAPPQQWDLEEIRALMLQVRVPGQSATDEAEVQAAFAQIVCRTIWDERKAGGATAGPVEAEPILHRYLDKTLESLGPLRSAALELLENSLVTRDGSRTLITQRQAEEALSVPSAAMVLDRLETAAVLHSEEHEGGRYFELGHDWLATKVLELKRERLREEENALRLQQEARRRRREHAARCKLVILTAAATAVALLLLGLFLWGLRAQLKAMNQSLMAGAREQLQQGQPAIAAKLLAMVEHPKRVERWDELALEALDANFLEVTLQSPGGETFNAASFSPDDDHIVTASDDGTVRVWRTDNTGEPQLLEGHTGPVTSAQFSPDGQFIVTASRDKTARVWKQRPGGGWEARVVFQHPDSVRSAGFSPDGQRIITVSRDGIARLWRTDDSGKPLEELSRGPGKSINFAAFSPDKTVQRIVTTSWDKTAQVWQADDSGRFSLREELPGHRWSATSAAFSQDGQRVVTASQDGTVRVWRAEGPGPSFVLDKQLRGRTGPVTSAQFSRDGRFIVTTPQDGTARVWRTEGSGPPVMLKALKGHRGPVTTAAFSHDGMRVVTASQDGTARVWHADVKSMRQPLVLMLMEHEEAVAAAAYSPDGWSIVTASQDGVARVWRADGSRQPAELKGHSLALTSVAFSPDGKRIVTTSWDRTARVWEQRPDGRWEEARLLEHKAPVQSAAFSRDGQFIVTAAHDGITRVWQADGAGGFSPRQELPGHQGPVYSASFSGDGRFIVTASRDKTARVWQADGAGRFSLRQELLGYRGPVTSAAFSPDGQRIVTASQDGTVRVWRAEGPGSSFVPDNELPRYKGPVQSAAFSPDGRFIVTTSWDGTARVWPADGSGLPRVLTGHEGPVRSAAFSPDGRFIVTASWDGTARRWLLPALETPTPGELLEGLEKWNKDCLSPAMRLDYLEEDKEEARQRYEECERDHRRVPSQAVALRSEIRAAGSPSRM